MSISLNGNVSNYLSIASSLGLANDSAQTWCGWFRPADTNTNKMAFAALQANGYTTLTGIIFGSDGNVYGYGGAGALGSVLRTYRADAWYFVYWRGNGSAFDLALGSSAYNIDSETSFADGDYALTQSSDTDALGALNLGRKGADGYPFNGEMRGVRVWGAQLSTTELLAEARSKTPVRTANLIANWNLTNNTDLTDTVNSYVLTANGTVSNGTTEPADIAEFDDDVVVRYYFDQAASGTAETQINDVSGNDYHLTEVNYGSGNMAWAEVSANRGLESTSTTGTQRARRGINNTSDVLRDAIVGAQKCTVEIKARVDENNANRSRLFCINDRVGGNPLLGFTSATAGQMDANWPDASSYSSDRSGSFLNGNTHVWHMVVDSTLENLSPGTGRIKLYRDGTLVSQSDSTIGQDELAALPADIDLTAFNRENSSAFDRSFDGVLFYAAIYDDAFTGARIADHYDVLAADDDEPAGEPPAEAPPRPAALGYAHLLVR